MYFVCIVIHFSVEESISSGAIHFLLTNFATLMRNALFVYLSCGEEMSQSVLRSEELSFIIKEKNTHLYLGICPCSNQG